MEGVYNLNNYIIYVISNDRAIVQNENGIVNIHAEIMVSFLEELDKKNKSWIDYNDINYFFGEKTKEAINFLVSNRIIKRKSEILLDVNRICIYSKENYIEGLLKKSLSNKYDSFLKVQSDSLENIFIKDIENELSVIILTTYNRRVAKEIRDLFLNKENSILSMNYIYNGNFYMDNFYNTNWKNPCHICNIGHIESQLRINNGTGFTYQQMVDLLYSEFNDLDLAFPSLNHHKVEIAANLFKVLNSYLNDGVLSKFHPENLTDVRMIDLVSLELFQDTTLHWEMCDCYE